jgi:hypothetical protein
LSLDGLRMSLRSLRVRLRSLRVSLQDCNWSFFYSTTSLLALAPWWAVCSFEDEKITINVPVVYMGRYKVVLRGDYP